MNTTTQVRIPSLVGGIPNEDDLVPSIFCAVFFFLALSPFIRRQFNPDTRIYTFAIASVSFSVERVVVWSLRAAMSKEHHHGEAIGEGCLVYQQVSFAIGFIALAMDLAHAARAVFVNATLEDPKRQSQDRPKLRARIRWICPVLGATFWIPHTLSAVAFSFYPKAVTSQSSATVLYILRYVGSALSLFMILGFVGSLIYLRSRIEHLDRAAINLLCQLGLVLAIIPTYRLCVMLNTTSILDVLPEPPSQLYPPGSLTTPASKATFFLFHSLPEIGLTFFMHSANLRGRFNTGPHGDYAEDDCKGIPRLRENGVITPGVGVGDGIQHKPSRRCLQWHAAIVYFFHGTRRTKDGSVEFGGMGQATGETKQLSP